MPAKRRLKLWIKVAVTSTLLALILRVVPWGELWSGVQSLDRGLWLTVWSCFLVGHLAGAFKWRLNVNIGRAGLGRTDAVQIYSAGLFANLCLPSIVGGDGLKAVLAGRATGRYESAIFGGLTERLIDTLALLLLIVFGSLVSGDHVPGWAGQVLQVGALVGVGAGVLFLPLALRIRLARWPARVRRPVGRAMVCVRRLWRRPQLALAVLLMSLTIQSWFVLLNAALGWGIGIDVPLAYWFLAIPLAKAITLVPISLGGFGLREVTLAAILGVVGVSEAQGVLASLLWQTVIVSTGLLGGGIWLALGLREESAVAGSLLDLSRTTTASQPPSETTRV